MFAVGDIVCAKGGNFGIVTKVTPKFVWMHTGLFQPYGPMELVKQTLVEKSSVEEAQEYSTAYKAFFNKSLYNTFTKKVDIAA